MLELDELWSFVGSKANARWVWIALCRQTRQIVAFFVGDRSAESARALRERIPPDYRCRATRSDFWLAYTSSHHLTNNHYRDTLYGLLASHGFGSAATRVAFNKGAENILMTLDA